MRKTREELIAMLRRGPEGVREFNEYRETNPKKIIDLRGASLGWANLRGANLFEASLFEAILHGTDFRGADLRFADLRRADLRVAYLYGATMHETLLYGADLHNVRGLKRTDWERICKETADTIKFDD